MELCSIHSVRREIPPPGQGSHSALHILHIIRKAVHLGPAKWISKQDYTVVTNVQMLAKDPTQENKDYE